MGYWVVYGLTGIVAVLCHGMTWWLRVGSRRITIRMFLALSVGVAVLASALLLMGGYVVDGYMNEPARLAAILVVAMLPISLLVGFPFWLLPPRRHPAGDCQKCGYDLTGNESGRCPECGKETAHKTHTSA